MRECINEVHFCWGFEDDWALERGKIEATKEPGHCANSPRRDTDRLELPMPPQATCLLCERPRKHGRYCNPCYSHVARGQFSRKTPLERFWEKVDKDGPIPTFRPELGPCWVWRGSLSNGYGHLNALGRYWTAHRFAVSMLVAPVPDGMDVDHLCRVPRCVRIDHLEVVTRAVNAQRGAGGLLVTECPQGHPYDEANTYWSKRRSRMCRTCHRLRERGRKKVAR